MTQPADEADLDDARAAAAHEQWLIDNAPPHHL
jgi:hypothetical protein